MTYETKIKIKSNWDLRGHMCLVAAFFKKEEAEAYIERQKDLFGGDVLEAEIIEHKTAKKGILTGRGLGKPDHFVKAE